MFSAILKVFIRPSSDGTYYGMVMSVRPSVRHSFPHFSPTCFEILSWNFVYHFILMHVKASSNAINFRQFLLELCPFLTANSHKYAVFRTFFLHALRYWAEILHITLQYCNTDQLRMSSICVDFCGSYAPVGTLKTGNTQFSALFSYMLWHIELKFCIWLCFTVLQIKFECRQFASIFVGVMPLFGLRILKNTVFRTFLLHALTYWAEILYMTLFYCTTDQVWVSSIRINFCRSNAPLGLRILEIHWQFSALFPYMLGHIELKFFISILCLMYYKSSSSVITLCPSGSPSGHLFCALSSCMHWQI